MKNISVYITAFIFLIVVVVLSSLYGGIVGFLISQSFFSQTAISIDVPVQRESSSEIESLETSVDEYSLSLLDIYSLTDTSEWSVYNNEVIGITFRYPSSWGEVRVENLSRTTREQAIQENACSGRHPYGVRYSIPDHDFKIIFSSSPLETEFFILKINPEDTILNDCAYPDASFDLIKNRKNYLKQETYSSASLILYSFYTSSNDISMFYYPLWHDSIGTSIRQFYKFYEGDLEVEAGFRYSPHAYTTEAVELEAFKCSKGQYDGCGLKQYILQGETSDYIREAFNDFHNLVDSIEVL